MAESAVCHLKVGCCIIKVEAWKDTRTEGSFVDMVLKLIRHEPSHTAGCKWFRPSLRNEFFCHTWFNPYSNQTRNEVRSCADCTAPMVLSKDYVHYVRVCVRHLACLFILCCLVLGALELALANRISFEARGSRLPLALLAALLELCHVIVILARLLSTSAPKSSPLSPSLF